MRIIKIDENDVNNGLGLRLAIYIAGCEHACEGCFNKAAWSFSKGFEASQEVIGKILKAIEYHDGLSVLGGEPLHPDNLSCLETILFFAKKLYPEKDIWVWTGYTWDEVKDLRIMKYIDFLVDGKYCKDQPTIKPWRGSDNQKLIKVSTGEEIF
jgi:anaerobic ribonucleoside-triphosphate reductase activating protein